MTRILYRDRKKAPLPSKATDPKKVNQIIGSSNKREHYKHTQTSKASFEEKDKSILHVFPKYTQKEQSLLYYLYLG